MKTPVCLMAAVMALVAFASCQNGAPRGDGKTHDEVYTGVLPAADADGVRYTLKLDYDDDSKDLRGDYDLVETYMMRDTLPGNGVTDVASFKSEGDFTSQVKDGMTYLKLVQDSRDSSAGSTAGPIYFLVESDSTLVMVNDSLQRSVIPDLNYTLKLVR